MTVDDDSASSGNESDLSSMRKIPLQIFVALFQWKYIFFAFVLYFGGLKIWNAGILRIVYEKRDLVLVKGISFWWISTFAECYWSDLNLDINELLVRKIILHSPKIVVLHVSRCGCLFPIYE